MINITVIGSGPAGLLFALMNANESLEIKILERLTEKQLKENSRALALSMGTINSLKNLGITPKNAPYFIPINRIHTSQKKSFGRVVMNSSINNSIGYVIEYANLVNILLEKIKDNPFVKIEFSCEIEKISLVNNSMINSKKNNINYDFLVFADGVGNLLDSKFEYIEDQEIKNLSGLVTKIETELDHNQCAYERFTQDGPIALLPLDRKNLSKLILTGHKGYIDDVYQLSDDKFEEFFIENFGERLGRIRVRSKKNIYPLNHKILKKPYTKNILILGNAAHSMHPVAGQGLNLTVRDLNILTTLISKNNFKIDQVLLDTYSSLRNKDIKSLMKFTSQIVKGFSSDIVGLQKLRSIGLTILDNNQLLKSQFIDRLSYGKN